MLESLADPLIHIVRNSLDHGLETPAERLAAGKPETGVVRISARHESDFVVIEVSDDGARRRYRPRARQGGQALASLRPSAPNR